MASIKRYITRREFLEAAGLTGLGLGLATWAPFTSTAAAAAGERTVIAPTNQRARKIRVTTIPGGAGNNIKFAADNFMQKYTDIEIQVDVAGGAETEYKPSFPQIAVSADRPDVAWYWVDGRQYQDLVAAGALEPLDEIYASEGLDKAYPEATLTKYTSPDGHRYAVNTDVVWYPQVYYNKAIFKECGIEPPADGVAYQSLDEWYQVCDKCRAKGYEPVTVGAKEGWRIGHTHDTLLQRIIPQELLDDLCSNWHPGSEPKISYSSPEWVAVDKMLKEWYDKGVFAEGDLGRSYAEGRAIFVQNKAAMYQDGSWAVSILRSEAPDLDFGWMLYPQVKPEIKPRFLLYAGNGVMVPKDPSDRDAAMKFAAYVTSLEYETLMVQNQEIGFAPSRVDVPADAMATLEPMVREMWSKLIEVGTSTGWDDPVPADMAERSFILFQEMLTGVREPESVGEEMDKIVARHRSG